MGCTASVPSRSPHGNKVLPDDGIIRKISIRNVAGSTTESVGKGAPSTGPYIGLCSCKSEQTGLSPRPKSLLMRVRGLGGEPEDEQQTSVEESSVKALDSPPLAKASQNGSRKDSTEGQESSGPSCAGSTGGAPSSQDDVTNTDRVGPESKTALRLPGAAESPTSPMSSDLLEAEAGRMPHPPGEESSSSPPLLSAALVPPTAASPAPPPDPLAVTRMGITLRGLRKLYDTLRERFGAQRLWAMSTEELAQIWLAEMPVDRRCRLLEAPALVDPSDVATPKYFVSHAWQNRAGLLFESVLGHYLLTASGAPEDDASATAVGSVVWIDLLAVNQHDGTEERRLDLAAVEDVVRVCSGGTIAVTDLAAGVNPARRLWCLYEWSLTLAVHGPDALHTQLDPYERSSIISGLDVRQASCKHDSDKALILSSVTMSYGTAEAFNKRLRLQLLLQPLSYREDLRRWHGPSTASLSRPASVRQQTSVAVVAAGPQPRSAQWNLSPIHRWLMEGADGPRVLCLLGGSGEGKSTLCAALCDPDMGLIKGVRGGNGGGAGPGSDAGGVVLAHHFVRFCDRRRQEPLGIVRSLAYQLAEGLPLMANYVLQLDAAEVAQLPADGAAAFEELLLKPLSAGMVGGQVVILIDGLDEADPLTPIPVAQGSGALLAPLSPTRLPAPLPGSDQTAALLLSPSARGSRVHMLPPTSLGGLVVGPPSVASPLPVCGNKVVQLLAKQLRRLPTYVRFVVSTDPGAMGGHVRAALDRAFADCGGVSYLTPKQLSIRPPPQSEQLSDGAFAADLASLHRCATGGLGGGVGCSGVLLYHTVMNECLAGAVGSSTATAAVKPLPAAKPVLPPVAAATVADLHSAYSQLFSVGMSRLGKSDLEAVRGILEVLLAAQEPLPVSLLAGMGLAGALHLLPGYGVLFAGPPPEYGAKACGDGGGGCDHVDTDSSDEAQCGARVFTHAVTWSLSSSSTSSSTAASSSSSSSPLFVSPEGRHTVRILHKSLVEWLADPRVSGSLLAVSPARGHARLAQHLLSQAIVATASPASTSPPTSAGQLNTLPAAADSQRGIPCRSPSPYALSYIVRHLVAGGDRDALDELLQQYAYLAAILSRGLGQTLIRDLLSLPCPSLLVCDMLRWLMAQQAVLVGTLTAEDVMGNLLQHCPVASAAFQAAQGRVLMQAAEMGRPGWRLRHGLGLPRNWPALRGMLEGHSRVVTAVSWSPDGRTLASGSGDGTVRLWESASGDCIATLAGHASDVAAVAWSPSGGALASGSHDGTVRLWDMATGDCVATLVLGQSGEEVRSVAWSFDGRALATGSNLGEVRVWDAASGECQLTLEGHVDAVLSVSWSPRGGVLASGGEDETVRLWHPASGQCTATMLGHAGCVRSVAWSPDGRTLASGSDDATIRLWDPSSDECVSSLEGHSWPVTCVCWSPDGRDLASGSSDQTIRLWDAGTGVCLGGLEEFSYSVSWSPDGRTLASGGSIDPCVRLWDVAASIGAAEEGAGVGGGQQGHSDIVNTVAWSPDGRTLASGSDDRTIQLWDTVNGESTITLEGPLDRVFSVSWSPDGRTLASGSRDMGVRLWNVKSGGCTSVLRGHLDTVYSVTWSPDGTALASGSGDKTIRLWAAVSGQCTAVLEGHLDTVWSVSWSPDGRSLASGSSDASVRLWEPSATSPRCTAKMAGHSSEVRSVSWSPDGRTLASGSIDMTIRIWEAITGNCVAVLRGHCGCVFSVAFSPDSYTLASGGRDKNVRVWNVTSGGELISVLQGHPDDVNTVAWSPDGRCLASGSDDETIRVYVRER